MRKTTINIRRTVSGDYLVWLCGGKVARYTYGELIELLMLHELMDPIVGHSLMVRMGV